jgi:RNA polymerase sigma-70 factor (ECF subfamily)
VTKDDLTAPASKDEVGEKDVNKGALPASKQGGAPGDTSESDRLDALCQKAQGGDKRAFDALVMQSYDRAYTIARNMLRSDADARDVVQEAFVRVQRGLSDFQGASRFTTWLYRVVVNLCLDQLRHKKRWGDKNPDALDDLQTAARSPEQESSDTELARALELGLKQLPDIHRATFLLFEVEGLSYEEIAKVTSVRVGTVMSRLFYARKKLQGFLAPMLGMEAQDAAAATLKDEG